MDILYIMLWIICIIIFITILFLGIYKFKKYHENMDSMPKIPLHIYQTWSNKNLPSKMKECVEKLKKDNPEFTYHLYDDDMSRTFIEKNYDKSVLNAYDKLIPGAFKADLWRYCILYKKGGIYLDIKFQCENNFKLINLTDKEYFVFERPHCSNTTSVKTQINLVNDPNYYKNIYGSIDEKMWKDKKIGIYNAVIICNPGNLFMKNAIDQCVKNIENNYYGHRSYYPTGPGMLADVFFGKDYKFNVSDFDLFYNDDGVSVFHKKYGTILSHYKEYRNEQVKHSSTPYYDILWNKHQIYR